MFPSVSQHDLIGPSMYGEWEHGRRGGNAGSTDTTFIPKIAVVIYWGDHHLTGTAPDTQGVSPSVHSSAGPVCTAQPAPGHRQTPVLS